MRWFRRLRPLWATWPGRLIVISSLLILFGLWLVLGKPDMALIGLGTAGLGGLLLLLGCIFAFPAFFAGPLDPTSERDHNRLLLENEIRTTLLQALLGVVVLLGALSTWQQFSGTSQELRISRNTQISQQFSSAAEQLGADQVEVRLGAIYTLERLLRTAEGEDGEQDSLTVYRLLASYVKARSPWPARPLDEDELRRGVARYLPLETGSLRKRAPDVQRALEIVGSRDKSLPEGLVDKPFLTDTDLRGAAIGGLHLARADLRGAALNYTDGRMPYETKREDLTDLGGADLRGADLRCANLQGVNLSGARLQNADLRFANLRGIKDRQHDAILTDAALQGARYNRWTQLPADSEELLATMKPDDNTTLAVHGADIVLVEGGNVESVKTVDGSAKEVVRYGTAVERNGSRLKVREPVEEADVVTCAGAKAGGSLYRPGTCPITTQRTCGPGQATVGRRSLVEQFLEELRAAAKPAARG
jgi:Pentapeptide repeats (8 copies)